MRERLVVIVAFTMSLLATQLAGAQPPGETPPGAGALGGSPYHAVAPPPEVYPSPMPTLPPPGASDDTGAREVAVRRGGFIAVIALDGSIHFDDHVIGGAGAGLGTHGAAVGASMTLDLTDVLMRAAGQDPYLTEKLRIMDSTRGERMELRRRHDAVVMRRALCDLPRYLAAVWNQRAWGAGVRRRLLFELWDEAAERGNQLLGAGGRQARRTIERFIAVNLPPGSPAAFTPGELRALNRHRASRQPFAPYGPATARLDAIAPPPVLRIALHGL